VRKSQEIFTKRNKINYEKEWLADYIEHQAKLFEAPPPAHSPPSSRASPVGNQYSEHEVEEDQQLEYGPGPSSHQEEVRPADLNKLFVRPEPFNGIKPPARQWLDQYEKAATANNWTDAAKIKYMATFLKESAYSWLTEVVPFNYPKGATWGQLRDLFVKCYLGESDRQSAKREFDKTIQKEGERASHFIPKMVQMIRQLDRKRPQALITDDIRHKLLPEYQEKLIMFELKTIEHLYNACTKIEAGMAASKAATRRREVEAQGPSRPRPRTTNRSSPNRARDSSSDREPSPGPSEKKDQAKCFRCDRNNHWARDCVARAKLDGTPLPDSKPKSVRFNNINIATDGNQSSDSEDTVNQSEDEGKPERTKHHTRHGGRDFVGSTLPPEVIIASVNNCGLIQQLVTCNGIQFKAIVDTGAFVSTMDAKVAAENGWEPQPSKLRLFHAVGEEMKCLGSIELKVTLQLAQKTSTNVHRFMVVENLCTNLILGIDIIRAMNIVLRPADKHQLQFSKAPHSKGVRAEETILPPRSVSLVRGRVQTEASVILVTPFGFDNSVHVGHTVCNVKCQQVTVPV